MDTKLGLEKGGTIGKERFICKIIGRYSVSGALVQPFLIAVDELQGCALFVTAFLVIHF